MLGLPIIATRLTVLEEYFGKDSIAFVPSGDPAAFASKVVELYNSPELRRQLARNTAEKSVAFSWKNQYPIYRDLLENMLQRRL